MNALEESVIVTNLKTIYKMGKRMNKIFLISLLFIFGCGSGKIVPTTDVCSVKKHYKDNVFQVYINKKPISNHYYIYEDAIGITKKLADQNKCMD